MIEKVEGLIIDNTPISCDQPTLQLSDLTQVVAAATQKLQDLTNKFRSPKHKPENRECLQTMAMAMRQYLLIKRLKAYFPNEAQHQDFIKALTTLENYSKALSPNANIWKTRASLFAVDEQNAYLEMQKSALQKIKALEEDVKRIGPAENSNIDLSVELETFTAQERAYGIAWYNDGRFSYQAPGTSLFTCEKMDWEKGTSLVLKDLYDSFVKQTEPWQHLLRRCRIPQISIAQMLSNSFATKSVPLSIAPSTD